MKDRNRRHSGGPNEPARKFFEAVRAEQRKLASALLHARDLRYKAAQNEVRRLGDVITLYDSDFYALVLNDILLLESRRTMPEHESEVLVVLSDDLFRMAAKARRSLEKKLGQQQARRESAEMRGDRKPGRRA